MQALNKGPIAYALDAAGTQGAFDSSLLMAKSVVSSTILCSVIVRDDRRFKMPVATTNEDFRIHPLGAPGPISIPARPADHWNAWKALHWAVDNYSTAFRLPSVDVVNLTAQEALQVLKDVSEGRRGFGKVVLQHELW